MKKMFITEAIVRGESYFGNVVCLFRPSKVSTILKSFFWSPLQVQVLCLAQLTCYGWVWCMGWEELVVYVRCEMCTCLALGGERGWRGGEWMRGWGMGFTNHVRTGGVLDVFGLWCCRWGVGRGLDHGLEGWGGVRYVSLDSLCRCQVQVSVYCAWRIPAHLRCTQCSILMDICFLPSICLWYISQIQTCLCVVVGPGFVLISPAFMRSSASHSAGPHDRLAQKKPVIVPPLTASS